MMKEAYSRRRKSKARNKEKEDRISSLPDEIICHILSFLPTKYAVATCILSSRWKLLWTSLPNLSFDDRLCLEYINFSGFLSEYASTRFENFVNSVLHRHSANINKFSVHYSQPVNKSCFKSWVSYAIRHNVRELELNHRITDDLMELPSKICTCKTLEVLKLKWDFVFKIPTSRVCFPSLKCLHVQIYYPTWTCFTEKLFTMCPVLEDLSIEIHLAEDDESVTKLNISSPTLKRLTLLLETDGYTIAEHQVMIRAPNLECLYIDDKALVSYMMHELHSLIEVHINIEFDEILVKLDPPTFPADCVVQLLKGITSTKFLSLSGYIICALNYAFVDYIPTFPYLINLELKVCQWRLLPIILSSLPNLESLKIVFSFVHDEFGWIEPQCVPNCLLLQVKKIEICGFDGQEEELELVKYLLKNSEVLDMVIIRSTKWASSKKLFKKLLMFERGSKTCKVELI